MEALSPGDRIIIGLDYGCTYSGFSLVLMGDQSATSSLDSGFWPRDMDLESLDEAVSIEALSDHNHNYFERMSIEDPMASASPCMLDPCLYQSCETGDEISAVCAPQLSPLVSPVFTHGYNAGIARKPRTPCPVVSSNNRGSSHAFDFVCKDFHESHDLQRQRRKSHTEVTGYRTRLPHVAPAMSRWSSMTMEPELSATTHHQLWGSEILVERSQHLRWTKIELDDARYRSRSPRCDRETDKNETNNVQYLDTLVMRLTPDNQRSSTMSLANWLQRLLYRSFGIKDLVGRYKAITAL